MNTDRSQALFARAQPLMPGGVNSPVRAFKSVGGEPFFVQRAEGAYLVDVDGNRYIDYVGSWGPMIVGHNHPAVLDAVIATARDGLSFGTPNPLEVTMAEAIARDTAAFNRFFHAMLERGVYLAPSAFEAGFMSSAHDDAIIDATIAAAREAFAVAKG